MERAIFITKIENFKYVNDSYSRLYFGNEFCERLLPSSKELREILKLSKSRGLKFTLVTPFVTEQGIKKISKLLKLLPKKIEVVFNDWGVFELLQKYDFQPVLGRLLTRQKRGPRIIKIIKIAPPEMVEYFKKLNITSGKVTRKFLIEKNIKRVEVDNLIQGINLIKIKELKYSLYVPYVYVSTTRLCLFHTPREEEKKFILGIFRCRKDCQKYTFTLTHKYMPVELILKGNTYFFKNEKIPGNLEESFIDRIVYQPELPI